MKVYDGGSKYSDLLIKEMTGIYKNTRVSCPGNQIFVTFETSSIVAKGGFKASVLENGIHYNITFLIANYKHKFLFLFIGDSCQYWMDLENQKLSSPHYPQNFFPDGVGCEWLITAPEGHIISLAFEHLIVSDQLNS